MKEQLDSTEVDLQITTTKPHLCILVVLSAWSHISKLNTIVHVGWCKTCLDMAFNKTFQIVTMEPTIALLLITSIIEA